MKLLFVVLLIALLLKFVLKPKKKTSSPTDHGFVSTYKEKRSWDKTTIEEGFNFRNYSYNYIYFGWLADYPHFKKNEGFSGIISKDITLYINDDTAYILSDKVICAPPDLRDFFAGCKAKHIIFQNFDTSKVNDMWGMFSGCTNLTSLDLSSFDTSKVNDMGGMFSGCKSLTSLDLSSFDTSKVAKMGYMFSRCESLTSLDLSNFNTSKVTEMEYMFSVCESLTSLDLSSFDTSKVAKMEYMFSLCESLTSLDLSNFDTSNATNMREMFSGCKSLTSLDLSNFNTSRATTMGKMFSGCTNLTSLDLSSFDTSNVTTMSDMFSGCTNLTALDLSSFNTSQVEWMDKMFFGCASLTSLDLSSFDTSNVRSARLMMPKIEVYIGSKWTLEVDEESYNGISFRNKDCSLEYRSLINSQFDKAKQSILLHNYLSATEHLIDCSQNTLALYFLYKDDKSHEGMSILELARMNSQERPINIDSDLAKLVEQVHESIKKHGARDNPKTFFEIIFSLLMSIKSQYEMEGFPFLIPDSELLEVRSMLESYS